MSQDKQEFIYLFDPKTDVSVDLLGRMLKNLMFQLRIGFPQNVYDVFSEEEKKHFTAIPKPEKSRIVKPR